MGIYLTEQNIAAIVADEIFPNGKRHRRVKYEFYLTIIDEGPKEIHLSDETGKPLGIRF